MGRTKTAEMLVMIDDVEAAGGKLYDQGGLISVDDADQELLTTIKAALGRREVRERRDYLQRNVRNAIETGRHLHAPFGYRKENGKGISWRSSRRRLAS